MAKKRIINKEVTPKSIVKNSLRMLFMRSRERITCLRNAKYSCQKCGVKSSVAKGKEQKIHVHHITGICNWDAMYAAIYKELLCTPDKMIALCPICHQEMHDNQAIDDERQDYCI